MLDPQRRVGLEVGRRRGRDRAGPVVGPETLEPCEQRRPLAHEHQRGEGDATGEALEVAGDRRVVLDPAVTGAAPSADPERAADGHELRRAVVLHAGPAEGERGAGVGVREHGGAA
ncbi:MAG: hypothetical protein U5K43_06920 [Halofilum sp. (in: g-proteobacteria)]|nr:hypothetical protein [Halofilum sp. (in: g-proteobacteria)]